MSNDILSEGRQNHLAHIITDGLWKDDLVDFTDDDAAFRVAKQAVAEFVKREADIQVKARAKVISLKRGVIEGSPEFDILFKKYCDEERNKRGT